MCKKKSLVILGSVQAIGWWLFWGKFMMYKYFVINWEWSQIVIE